MPAVQLEQKEAPGIVEYVPAEHGTIAEAFPGQ